VLKCAFCGRRLEPTATWTQRAERYFCNAFCAEDAFWAEAEQSDWPSLVESKPPAVTDQKRA
jgi:hypothetical protein